MLPEHPPLVLVVEDEPTNRAFLAECLNMFGCRCHLATDGQEGLQLAQELSPDLIILDLEMPVMNGEEMLRALRAHATTAGLPVILVSSWLDSGVFDLTGTSASDSLTKPFTIEQLFERGHRYLPSARLPQAT